MNYTEEYTDEIRNMIHRGCLNEYKDENNNIYKSFITKKRGTCSSYKVPKKIHLCWIGSELPERYVPYINSFVKHNGESYQINLWLSHKTDQKFDNVTMRNIHDYSFFHEDKIFKDPENKYARSADILRYEIIYLLGGIYYDIDTMCLRQFDENFDHSLVSYTGYPWHNICNAFFAFPAKTEFLKYAIDCIDACYGLQFPHSVGPTFFTTCCHAFNDKNIRMINQKYLGFVPGTNEKVVFAKHDYHCNWC